MPDSSAMAWEGDHNDFPMRTFQLTDADGKPWFLLNPVVAFIGMAILWGLSIWCMIDPVNAAAVLIEGRTRLSAMFTFFYVGTNPAFMVSSVCATRRVWDGLVVCVVSFRSLTTFLAFYIVALYHLHRLSFRQHSLGTSGLDSRVFRLRLLCHAFLGWNRCRCKCAGR